MSNIILNRVWFSENSSVKKSSEWLILLALADMANDLGICWPGQDHLLVRCKMSLPTLTKGLGTLERAGLVEVYPQPGKNHYYLVRLGQDEEECKRAKRWLEKDAERGARTPAPPPTPKHGFTPPVPLNTGLPLPLNTGLPLPLNTGLDDPLSDPLSDPSLGTSGGESSGSFLSGNSEQPKENTTIRKAKPKKGYPTYQIPPELDTPGFRDGFEEWVTWRREELRKPVTDLAAKKALDALLPFGAVWAISRMNQAIVRGWTGLVFSNDVPGSNHNGSLSSEAAQLWENVVIPYRNGRTDFSPVLADPRIQRAVNAIGGSSVVKQTYNGGVAALKKQFVEAFEGAK